MAQVLYTYSQFTGLTGGNTPNPSTLTPQVATAIVDNALLYINTDQSVGAGGGTVYFNFTNTLSGPDTTLLNGVVSGHSGVPPIGNSVADVSPSVTVNGIISEADSSGSHYQASAATISAAGTINIPSGQAYQVNGVSIASTTTPLVDGTASIGTGTTFALGNHVHPTDTSRQAALTNPVTGTGITGQLAQFNGTSTLTSVAENTAFNQNFETTATNIKMNGAQSVGALSTIARADHIHPTDTTKADKIVPTVTGDIATLGATGNLVDSGIVFSDATTTTTNVWSASKVNSAISSAVTGGTAYQGTIACAANPNYPAGTAGWFWIVSTSGLIGGASGFAVTTGDTIFCQTTSVGGTQAAVGANFDVVQAVTGAIISTDSTSAVNNIVIEAGTAGKTVTNSAAKVTTAGSLTLPASQTITVGANVLVNATGGISIPTGQTYQINGSNYISSVAPGMDGVAAAGATGLVADAGHIHPIVPFGTQFNQAVSLAQSSTTSTTQYSSKVSIVTGVLPAGNYYFNWYAETAVGTANRNNDIYILLNQIGTYPGTITTTTSSTTVTGVGTSFTAGMVGMTLFSVSGVLLTKLGVIASYTSATSVALTANALAASAGASYEIDTVMGNPDVVCATAWSAANNMGIPVSGVHYAALANAICGINLIYKVGSLGASTAYMTNATLAMYRIS